MSKLVFLPRLFALALLLQGAAAPAMIVVAPSEDATNLRLATLSSERLASTLAPTDLRRERARLIAERTQGLELARLPAPRDEASLRAERLAAAPFSMPESRFILALGAVVSFPLLIVGFLLWLTHGWVLARIRLEAGARGLHESDESVSAAELRALSVLDERLQRSARWAERE